VTTVLVAEDDRDIRDLVTAVLVRGGFEVLTADDGPTALDVVRQESPALAVLDVMMPGMSGFDVCRQVRSGPGSPTAVIMLTARSQEADVLAGFAAGADDYVAKPFSPQELLSRVRAVLDRLPT